MSCAHVAKQLLPEGIELLRVGELLPCHLDVLASVSGV
jgi:hypothetical protein